MKKIFKLKYLFVLTLFMLLPMSVFADSVYEDCKMVRGSDVTNTWTIKDIKTLEKNHIYYCHATDDSNNGDDTKVNGENMFKDEKYIYELLYYNSASDAKIKGKIRAYCLNFNANAPTDQTLTRQYDQVDSETGQAGVIMDKGPSCAFYKYNGTGDTIRHNRIRYIQYACAGENGNTCSATPCTDKFISNDCVGDRKSKPSDAGNGIEITRIDRYSKDDNFYIYKASVKMSGKVTGYTPSLTTSVSGAVITDTLSGNTSVTSTSSSTLYVKVPVSAVDDSLALTLNVVSDTYSISCTYDKFGMVYYYPSKKNSAGEPERVVGFQRIGFRVVKTVKPVENKTKNDSIDFTIIPDEPDVRNSEVNIKKIDADTGDTLAGVKFGLYSDSSCETSVADVNGDSESVTSGYGYASFVIPEDATYYIKELSTLDGYVLSNTCQKATTDGTITVSNSKKPEELVGKIIVKKLDITDGTPIEGVKFQLLKEDKTTSATDIEENDLGILTTNSEGMITVENIPYGTYYLKEVETLDIYMLSDELTEIVLTDDSETVTVNNMKRLLSFYKIDSVSKEAIGGGKYRIVDEEGNAVAEFTMEDGVYSEAFAEGKYTFIEVTPPKGYVDANVSFDFKVSDDGIATITSAENKLYYLNDNGGIMIVNNKEEIVPDVPKTGVLTNEMIIGLGALLIIGGASSIIIIKRKNS